MPEVWDLSKAQGAPEYSSKECQIGRTYSPGFIHLLEFDPACQAKSAQYIWQDLLYQQHQLWCVNQGSGLTAKTPREKPPWIVWLVSLFADKKMPIQESRSKSYPHKKIMHALSIWPVTFLLTTESICVYLPFYWVSKGNAMLSWEILLSASRPEI